MYLEAVALVFLSVFLGSVAVLGLVFADDRRVSRRLKELSSYEVQQAHEAQPLLKPFGERVVAPALHAAVSRLRLLMPADSRKRAAKKITQAGADGALGVDRFLFAKTLCAVGGAGLAASVAAVAGWSVFAGVFGTVAFGVVMFFVPDAWLDSKIERRRHDIVRSLPDMLDMLTISVEAGLGFDAALSKLVRSSTGPLAEEFGRALQEVQAGTSRKEALRHMAKRADVPELATFTSAIVQADIFGISVAQVLRTQAGEMRLRRRQRAEETAQKAPVKIVIPLVVCVLPATIIVVAGPAVIRVAQIFS